MSRAVAGLRNQGAAHICTDNGLGRHREDYDQGRLSINRPRSGGSIVPSAHHSAFATRICMAKRALAKTFVFWGILASQGAWAAHGFRPGLWAVREVFTGSLRLTSRGLRCLQNLGQGQNGVAVLGPAGGLSGPVAIHIKRGVHETKVVWRDNLRLGPTTTIDYGRYTFTDRARGDFLHGSWTRTQTFPGRTTIMHEALQGHWVAHTCPGTLPSSTRSSPTLAALATETAALKAGAASTRAQLAQMKQDGFP